MAKGMRWDRARRNPHGYEQAEPRGLAEKLARASARQMARHLGKEPPAPPPESGRRRRSREQFEETQRIVAMAAEVSFEERLHRQPERPENEPEVECPRPPSQDVGRPGFFAELRYGRLVAVGVLPDGFWRQP